MFYFRGFCNTFVKSHSYCIRMYITYIDFTWWDEREFFVSSCWVVRCTPFQFQHWLFSRIRKCILIAKTMTFSKELSWNEEKFGMFMGIFGFIGIFTQYVAVPFFVEVVGLHDTTIGILGVIGCAINSVRNANHCYALCGDRWLLYLNSIPISIFLFLLGYDCPHKRRVGLLRRRSDCIFRNYADHNM